MLPPEPLTRLPPSYFVRGTTPVLGTSPSTAFTRMACSAAFWGWIHDAG